MRTLMLAATVATFCFFASPALAGPSVAEPGDVLVKMRGGYSFRSQSDTATFSIDGKSVSVKVDDGLSGEAGLDFFISENLAVEASLGGSSYDVRDANGRSLASAGRITPTVTVLFYPTTTGRIRPYFGAGVAYLSFYSEKPGEVLTNINLSYPVSYSADIKSNLGPVGQVGFDLSVNDKFYINVDGKYQQTKSKMSIIQGPNTQTVKQDVKEFVVGAGVGFKF